MYAQILAELRILGNKYLKLVMIDLYFAVCGLIQVSSFCLVSNHLENSFWDKLKEEALNKQLRAEIKNRANPVMLAKKLIQEQEL